MHHRPLARLVVITAALITCATLAAAQPTATAPIAAPEFEITFERSVSDTPFTGRVFLILTKRKYLPPIELVEWFTSEPVFARDVKAWQPGDKLRFTSDNCISYPTSLAELPARTYRAQAVMGLNEWDQHPLDAPGNGYSDVAVFKHPSPRPVTVRLVINHKLRPEMRSDDDKVKYVKLRSKLLSDFHGRDVYLQAAVGLPNGHDDKSDRRFPAVYAIPGFDGRMRFANPLPLMQMLAIQGLDAAVVYLGASCPTGHHVFADSANNGPWGQALVTELIPYLEERFRLIPDANARFVTGFSSGGWSSLWLQVAYPDSFGGVWAMCPDPVDFTAFMRVNIYCPQANMYVRPDGGPFSLTRPGYFGRIEARELCEMENVFGRGGQLGSFEAVFSPRGLDGRPARLWDRATGKIDPAVAAAWRKYDIRHVIESDWKTLGPKLAGKLHLFCGDRDDFYLDEPFFKLRDALTRVGSDAYVEVLPGAGHMLPPTVLTQAAAQMAERFAAAYKNRQDQTEMLKTP